MMQEDNEFDFQQALKGYPEAIRRIIYPTNTIEAVNRQFWKLTKTKGAFPNQDRVLKLLYMGIQNACKKWTMPIQTGLLPFPSRRYFLKEGWIRN